MKAVIDTNVLVSACLRDRVSEQVVLFVATQVDWQWLATQAILDEYIAVLRRPKFRLDEQIVEAWASLIRMRVIELDAAPAVASTLRDPKDAPFLAAALAGGADYLITGDEDLLALKSEVPFAIVTVHEFATQWCIPGHG